MKEIITMLDTVEEILEKDVTARSCDKRLCVDYATKVQGLRKACGSDEVFSKVVAIWMAVPSSSLIRARALVQNKYGKFPPTPEVAKRRKQRCVEITDNIPRTN